MRVTYFWEVVAIQEGRYVSYVFKNLDEVNDSLLRYITVTKIPNWDIPSLVIGDVGYFECEYVNAGDTYYKTSTETTERYNYTSCYLLNFIRKDKQINQKEFNF